MRPISTFLDQDREFWAHVRFISEQLGYSNSLPKRVTKDPPVDSDAIQKISPMRRYTAEEIVDSFEEMGLRSDHLVHPHNGQATDYGQLLLDYLSKRADLIERQAMPSLMNREEAEAEFDAIRHRVNPECPLPMNRQKGEKRHVAFLTGMVNMLAEEALGGVLFNGDPQALPVVMHDGRPLRTLSRRLDGAYPNVVNSHVLWETKEYYGTTTFGSRVADGVYETQLDGEELAELYATEGIKVEHYLIVDDRFTWWMGRSYLCRMIDMMHMRLVDEVLFGREVIQRWPQIVASWPQA